MLEHITIKVHQLAKIYYKRSCFFAFSLVLFPQSRVKQVKMSHSDRRISLDAERFLGNRTLGRTRSTTGSVEQSSSVPILPPSDPPDIDPPPTPARKRRREDNPRLDDNVTTSSRQPSSQPSTQPSTPVQSTLSRQPST
jgi:hypothetical protein